VQTEKNKKMQKKRPLRVAKPSLGVIIPPAGAGRYFPSSPPADPLIARGASRRYPQLSILPVSSLFLALANLSDHPVSNPRQTCCVAESDTLIC
jgi:hypothetical protein